MKQIKFMALLMFVGAGFALTSCSEDEDDDNTVATSYADQIAGTYDGIINMSMAYGSYDYTGQSVSILTTTGNEALVSYNGDFGVANIVVTVSQVEDGSYTFAGTGTIAMSSHSSTSSDYDCTVAGTIAADKSDYTIVFTIPSVMGGTTLTLTPATVAKLVAGTYTGTMNMSMAYGSYDYEEQTVTITATGDNTVTIAYSGDLGECTIEDVEVTENADGTYSYSGEATFNMGMTADSVKEYACTYAGTISADQSDYTIAFTLPSVMGGTTLTLTPAAE